MWLVAKGAKTANGGEPVDPALAATLRIWYQGRGDHVDEKHALVLVRGGPRNACWARRRALVDGGRGRGA
jgi:hypothetical protein